MIDIPTDWPFNSPPDEAVITLRSIIEDRRPILIVSHDAEDGYWQFLDGSYVSEEDARVVSRYYMLSRDPTLAELADLPEGWRAWRQTTQSEWVTEKRLSSGEGTKWL